MELPVQPSTQPTRGRNYETPPWCYLLWGVPALIVVGASEAYQFSILPLIAAHSLWVIAVGWAGIGCFINGRTCGRVHCRVDGIAFPLLSVVGALNLASLVPLDWNLFWAAFFVILIGSFIPELVWKKYS